jgi:hypothetical protein
MRTIVDHNFQKLRLYADRRTGNHTNIIQSIPTFRNKFSVRWFRQFPRDDPMQILGKVRILLSRIRRRRSSDPRLSLIGYRPPLICSSPGLPDPRTTVFCPVAFAGGDPDNIEGLNCDSCLVPLDLRWDVSVRSR